MNSAGMAQGYPPGPPRAIGRSLWELHEPEAVGDGNGRLDHDAAVVARDQLRALAVRSEHDASVVEQVVRVRIVEQPLLARVAQETDLPPPEGVHIRREEVAREVVHADDPDV